MLAKLFFASLRANLGRTLLALAGIALGVALGLAVHVINQSAIGEMQQATRTLGGDADLSIRAGRGGSAQFDENLLEIISADERVQMASPVIEADATLVSNASNPSTGAALQPYQPRRTIKFIGIDVFRAALLQPGFAGEAFADNENATDQFAMLRPDHVFLNQAARVLISGNDKREFSISVSGIAHQIKVAGKAELSGYAGPLAIIDIAGAQTLFNQVGEISRIDIRLIPGANPVEVARDISAKLPAGVIIATPEQTDKQSAAVSRAYRINLTVLSLVALFTGGFLVFSTQNLSVLRRRAQFALYRTLGVTQGELMRALVAEGAVLGLIGGIAGAALGLWLAIFALAKFGGDLGSGFFAGTAPTAQWTWLTLAFFAGLGVAAGIAGAFIPARTAIAEAPARAIKANDGEGADTKLPPTWVGVALVIFSGVLLALPAFDDIPWLAYAAIAALLLGVLALSPIVSTKIIAHLPRSKNPIAQLSLNHIEKSPGPSSAGITGVVASFSLMIAMLIMVVSFRSSLEQWLIGVLNQDLYVRQGSGESNALNTSTGAALQALSDVENADFLRYRSVVLDASKPEQPPVTLITRPLRENVLQSLSVLKRAPIEANIEKLPDIWISEAVADLYGYAAGQKIALPLDGKTYSVFVAGIWRDYARSFGAMVIDREIYLKWTADEKINDVSLKIAAGANKANVIAAIRALPGGDKFDIADAAEIRKFSLQAFDRSFAVTYALEIAAIFVGLAGISATFSAQAWSRRREFGMLRHLGITRREIAALLGAEGALLGALGAAIGLALGVAIALILIFVVNRESFHWSMELHIPWITMAILSVALVVLTAISAVLSGKYAMSKQVVMTVKEDA
jgi:putative ABC transport system permease protein